jgi:DNA-directed RNA polymerase subunit RPC12/RpoP
MWVAILVCLLRIAECAYGDFAFNTTSNCNVTNEYSCGRCEKLNSLLFQDTDSSPVKLKYVYTCSSCTKSEPRGNLTVEYTSNGTLISGKDLYDADKLCFSNLMSFHVHMMLLGGLRLLFSL